MTAVEARAGGDVPGGLETAIRSTLRALGGQLTCTPAAIAEAVGDDLAAELDAGRKQPPVAPDELVAALGRKLRARTSVALEVIESVVAELASRIGPVARLGNGPARQGRRAGEVHAGNDAGPDRSGVPGAGAGEGGRLAAPGDLPARRSCATVSGSWRVNA